MFIAQTIPVLADSAAVHAGAVALGQSLAGALAAQLVGLDPKLVTAATVAIGTAFGLAASKAWHFGAVQVHNVATSEYQAKFQDFWGRYGRAVSALISYLVASLASHNWLVGLIPLLGHIPSAAVGGVSSTLANQKAANVSRGRVGALVLLLAGASLLCMPTRARAASGVASIVAQPTDAAGHALPFASWHRTVFTGAVGEGWTGPKATDHPVPYGRLGVGYQWSAPVQTCFNLRRDFRTGSTWRPELELKLILAP